MVKNNSKFSKTRKSIIAALCAVTVTCTGLAAACSNGGNDNGDESSSFKREDTVQVLKNGTFENYSVPKDAVYLIKNIDGWSRSGDSSNAMSGIIGTSAKAWAALTDNGLYDKLQYNNDLDPDDEDYEDNYVDYNGMKTRDMLYRDTYSALLENKDNKIEDSFIFTKHDGFKNYFGFTQDGEDFYFLGKKVAQKEDDENDKDYYFVNEDGSLGESVRLALIENPGTHYDIKEDDNGLYFLDEGTRVDVFEDEESGDYYRLTAETADEGDDNKEFISNVLMVHNYPTDSKYNGIQQYYSSQTITLEANTAAEISLWVKTSELRFDKGFSQLNDQDRGAFIEVTQTVNGSSVSSFKIKSINTEKIIADKENGLISFDNDTVSNGWLRYTIYVNACDFGDSTITINLGLGQAGKNSSDYSEKCTGYAFFDDVTVTKYRSLDDENCTYNDNEGTITAAKTQCTLVTDDKEKIFIADRALSNRNMTGYTDQKRNSDDFYYLIDLASENGDISETYSAVNFTSLNTTAKFTTEKITNHSVSKYYSSANQFTGTSNDISTDFNASYVLPDNLPQFRNTAKDLVGAYTVGNNFTFSGDWATKLNKDLLGEKGLTGLPKYDENTSMLVLASSNGAAYTATIAANDFTVAADKYMIVSFWVKTSDMNGKTAATVRISDGTEENEQFITIDSTGKTTDFNEEEKDIYNGWVQCFFFVENDTEASKTFTIDFSFGNMSIAATTTNSYKGGWAALANMQVLSFDNEDVYSLSSTGDYSQKFAFTEDEDDNSETPFDTPSGTSNIKESIATPSSYDGVNGGSSAVSQNDYKANYDEKNTNDWAGLINRDDFDKYANKTYILQSFISTANSWNDVFGEGCYQPLIIINTLRAYADSASANENTYTQYYIESSTGDVEIDGKKYRLATEADEYDPNETYYSIGSNYGFIGADNSVSSNSYKTISVKVMVSKGAVAYVYLVDGKTREVLGYTTPEYTFYYDDEGNVLDKKFDEDWTDSEHKGHVKYTLQNNGLYKDENGVIRANLYNLTKAYKYIEFQGKTLYTADGETVSYQKLEKQKFEDKIYYYDQAGTVEADHYLVNSDNVRVYRFKNGKYYYMVNGEVSSQVVENFDAENLAVKGVHIDEKYAVTVENPDGSLDGKWVTVSFYIHTGSEEKDYRLELWSGMRDEAGKLTAASGAVAFDYNYEEISEGDDFNKVREFYEKEIIEEYKNLLSGYSDVLKNENIAYYETEIAKLVEEGEISEADVKAISDKYTARYYTYTLYDDDTYIPFNAEIAKDGETGYDYKITDEEYSERLAYLEYNDKTSHSVFIDYSAVDQSISIGTTSDDEGDDSESPETDWLIITSIILVVVLLFALASIVARDVIKRIRKKRGVKSQSKNMYRKRERYIKKLHLVKNEPESGESEADAPAEEEAPAEEPTEEVTPVETAEPATEEKTPAEEPTEEESPKEE